MSIYRKYYTIEKLMNIVEHKKSSKLTVETIWIIIDFNLTKPHFTEIHKISESLRTLLTNGHGLKEIKISHINGSNLQHISKLLDDQEFKSILTLDDRVTLVLDLAIDQLTLEELRAFSSHKTLSLAKNVDLSIRFDHITPLNFLDKSDKLKCLSELSNKADVFCMFKIDQIKEFSDKITELNKHLETLFKTKVEFLIRFFEDTNQSFSDQLEDIKNELQGLITKQNYKNFLLPLGDNNLQLFGKIRVLVNNSEISIHPVVYEPINLYHQSFLLGIDELNLIPDRVNSLNLKQLKYAARTKQCADCKNMNSCVSKNVLNIMEIHSFTQCIFPKKVLEMMNLI
jgi:hypothetical protein